MAAAKSLPGQTDIDELAQQRRANSGLLWSILLFSMFTNLLMLTGPLYMLQVYDRVLGSRSEETLLALSLLVTFLFVMMGVLDYVRGRVAARVGARLQDGLDSRVFGAALTRARREGGPQTGLQDLEAVQRLLSTPAFLAIFDIPWTPIFLAAIFIFHPWLGWLALAGGALLIVITLINQATTRAPLKASGQATMRADRMAGQLQSEAELIRSLGMQGAAFRRWRGQRETALGESIRSSDRVGGFTTLTKTLRLFLQSAMLGLGAYLVLQAELTAGAMIAGSILLGRALAPIELAIGQWAMIQRAREGWANLRTLLADTPPEPQRLPLPRPEARLDVHQLAVVPPGESQATLRMVSFRVEPGQAVGVIGQSGAGKSTLAKALTGVWSPAAGQIRLDGATLDQYDPDVLGSLVGYLPQTVTLFDGTIAENIARLSANPDPDAVVAAARKAAAHDLILNQPKGYDTQVTAVGSRLSGGQIQRIGLARALHGDPVLLVLDEPNSNLDNDGSEALNQAIREMKSDGRSVLIMAHRPAAIRECDMLLVLDGGMPKAFGPRDEVLKKTVQNHAQIAAGGTAGGVS
ncbi:type I secretion system permease/ATPase [Roseobacter sp. HKCCD9010]|uniref:type I secretion system permease/ATPase n=1 Tax=unclassified Roseobacter TaxID=196798 RepID=UPI00149114DD|nr:MULTISPECIES: type I secretion system permease/ATPase [unclassified Roseobacter]MBF9051078.1 type I secretion system permease/ATPase [Rhodobacterales bacterium HKCCD4356]NNV12847.1 type I secretion system permease/ATPase [Roseobacter sp. HKCCD7357]NNV16792.1 type I secretion system permease/ATPase [Roseobacter sp. HKCCD8768]NNV26576.1 type I secretion system permease/ATPase [Roseobacter sp. HKCCD8192]NNV30513.1 type I secretion system permease/ATPase [Roseobacter sp. HKCCD9061]